MFDAVPLRATALFCLGICHASQAVLDRTPGGRGVSEPLLGNVGQNDVVAADSLPEVSPEWYPPAQTSVNNLTTVLEGTGVHGFIFNGSETPSSLPYSTYNWCNMPRVRSQEYPRANHEYKLEYVEVIHRHHKRTPYAANTFPQETYPWYCDEQALFYYGAPAPDDSVAAISWQVYTSSINPFRPSGFNGTCQFPQITQGGLLDSRQHGKDLYGVYHDVLQFLPDTLDRSKVSFRVTNNQITSQVAGQVILGMYPSTNHKTTKVLVQPPSVDSLEPKYPCPAASKLYSAFGTGSTHSMWLEHLQAASTTKLFSRLDSISGVALNDSDWHDWFDHYFDNLSARLCHEKPLPCNVQNSSMCCDKNDADAVFRRGEYEYSFIYRDSPDLFRANVASYGVWLAELAANLRSKMAGKDEIIYRHNVAHDGSISKLLSILQVDVMVWPGMGSELVFELYSKADRWYLRVFWAGQVLTSSNPSLGRIDMLPVETFLAYIDGLVGVGASRVPQLCSLSGI